VFPNLVLDVLAAAEIVATGVVVTIVVLAAMMFLIVLAREPLDDELPVSCTPRAKGVMLVPTVSAVPTPCEADGAVGPVMPDYLSFTSAESIAASTELIIPAPL